MVLDTTVYLVLVVEGKWVAWHTLAEDPTYFGKNVVTRRPDTIHTWMTAQREGECCVVFWRDAPLPSPLPNGSTQAKLAHGAKFTFGTTECVVWSQLADAPWAKSGVGTPSEVLHQLDAMDDAQRVAASHRFLELPTAARRWHEDFVKATGFVVERGGRTPKARSCELLRVEDGYDLRWDATIWDKFAEIWVPDRESASFSRVVRGVDLVLLRDCATILTQIPVTTA